MAYVVILLVYADIYQVANGAELYLSQLPSFINASSVLLEPILILWLIGAEMALNIRLVYITTNRFRAEPVEMDNFAVRGGAGNGGGQLISRFHFLRWKRSISLKRKMFMYICMLALIDSIMVALFMLGIFAVFPADSTSKLAISWLSLHFFINFSLLDLFVSKLKQVVNNVTLSANFVEKKLWWRKGSRVQQVTQIESSTPFTSTSPASRIQNDSHDFFSAASDFKN